MNTMGAILDSIPTNTLPATLDRAEFVAAYNDETSAMGKVEQARAALDEAQRELDAATARRIAAEQS